MSYAFGPGVSDALCIVHSKSDFGLALLKRPPRKRLATSLSGEYWLGPGVWLAFKMIQSISDFGFASEILIAPAVFGRV